MSNCITTWTLITLSSNPVLKIWDLNPTPLLSLSLHNFYIKSMKTYSIEYKWTILNHQYVAYIFSDIKSQCSSGNKTYFVLMLNFSKKPHGRVGLWTHFWLNLAKCFQSPKPCFGFVLQEILSGIIDNQL